MEYKLASSTWDHRELEAIQRVIESDRYTMGEEVAKYEVNFSKYFGSKYAIMTSSGSTANLLMIAAMFFTKDESRRLKRGDEVIVPAVSWSTTYFPLQQYGLKVKFVDIDRETLNINLDKLENAISDKTKLSDVEKELKSLNQTYQEHIPNNIKIEENKKKLVEVNSKWEPDKSVEAKFCYGTNSLDHPAVKMIFYERGRFYVGGKIYGFELP